MKGTQKTSLISITILILSIYLVSCGASENQTEETAAQTESAIPTETGAVLPTSTIPPTRKPTLTSSSTPDLRIIELDPKEFLLSEDDLPRHWKYYLPDLTWIGQNPNSEIISQWEGGLDYLEKTGRIDGWWTAFEHDPTSLRVPEQIYHNIIQYETIAGAQITVLEYNNAETATYSYVERDLELGDVYVVLFHKELQSNGKYRVWYEIDTAYHNYVSIVWGYGWEDEVVFDYIEEIARIALEKLMDAPLIDP